MSEFILVWTLIVVSGNYQDREFVELGPYKHEVECTRIAKFISEYRDGTDTFCKRVELVK